MKKAWLLLMLLIFVASCAPSQDAVQTAIAQTQSAITQTQSAQKSKTPYEPITTKVISTNTPTPIPLGELDLESILIKPGDMPAGFSGAQISKSLPEMFKNIPKPTNKISQQIEFKGNVSGGIAVIVYESDADVKNAFDIIAQGMSSDAQPVLDLGLKAMSLSMNKYVEATEVAFIECKAVVHARFVGTSNANSAINYARRLDDRLKNIVCRP